MSCRLLRGAGVFSLFYWIVKRNIFGRNAGLTGRNTQILYFQSPRDGILTWPPGEWLYHVTAYEPMSCDFASLLTRFAEQPCLKFIWPYGSYYLGSPTVATFHRQCEGLPPSRHYSAFNLRYICQICLQFHFQDRGCLLIQWTNFLAKLSNTHRC